jgi:hypothetical protein
MDMDDVKIALLEDIGKSEAVVVNLPVDIRGPEALIVYISQKARGLRVPSSVQMHLMPFLDESLTKDMHNLFDPSVASGWDADVRVGKHGNLHKNGSF